MKRILLTILVLLAATAAFAEGSTPAKVRNVAIFIYEGAEILDFAGPAEVLEASTHFVSHDNPPLKLFTVAATKEPITSQRFLKLVPDYSIADAPKIDVLVIPGGNSGNMTSNAALMDWFRRTATDAEVTLTVCTGAVPIAKAGFLDGLEITTWYGAIDRLQKDAPKTIVKNGRRFVDNGKFITTAGVSAGIDGSLHLVARLFGRRVADQTARYMEYHWSPEPWLAANYPLLNPSTDDRGRAKQTAEIQRESKSWNAAVQAYNDLTKSDPKDTESWWALAEVYRHSGEHAKSIPAYERAMQKESNKQWAYAAIARAHALLEHRAEAIDYLAKAVDAGFKNREALLSEPAFASYRDDAKVKAIVAKLE